MRILLVVWLRSFGLNGGTCSVVTAIRLFLFQLLHALVDASLALMLVR